MPEPHQEEPRPAPDHAPDPSALREALSIYALVFALVLALALAASASAPLAANLYALVAAVFIGVPYAWMWRRKLDPDDFGLSTRELGRGVLIGLGATLLTMLLFIPGQYIWETQVRGARLDLSVEHLYRWPVTWEGEPAQWQRGEAGAWLWSDAHGLQIGMRSRERERGALVLEGDRPFVPQLVSSGAQLRAFHEDGSLHEQHSPAQRWELRPTIYTGGVRATVARHNTHGRSPRRLTLRTLRIDGYEEHPLPLHAGGEPLELGGEEVAIERGLGWLGLWWITQLFFIALPEEYFYRGYLLTRLREASRARGWPRLGPLSAENVLTSVLFGLGHLLIPVGGVLLATRATVFFPSLLFGLLRERTGTIVAPVVYHAGCNMMVILWAVHYR